MSHLLNTAGTAPAEAAAWPNVTDAATPALPSLVRLAWNAALPKGCNKLVLMCLAYYASKSERAECFPHVETVARLCGMHPRTVSLHLRALATAGLIVVTPRPNRSSVYRLVRTRLAALSSERPAVVQQVEHPVESLPELPDPAIPDPVIPASEPAQDLPLDPVIPASRPGVFCTHKGEEGGRKEEGRESVRETNAMPLLDQPSLPRGRHLQDPEREPRRPRQAPPGRRRREGVGRASPAGRSHLGRCRSPGR